MRILHLIDPGSPGGGGGTLRLLADLITHDAKHEHVVLMVGNAAHKRLAHRCGLSIAQSVSVPAMPINYLRSTLRKLVSWQERHRGRFDVLHLWSGRLGLNIELLWPDRPCVGWLGLGPVTRDIPRRKSLEKLGTHSLLLTPSDYLRRSYRIVGVPEDRIHVVHPGVDINRTHTISRRQIRAAWGVSDQTFVVALLAEPIAHADLRAAISIVSRVAETGLPLRLATHSNAASRSEAMKWARGVGWDLNVIEDDAVAEPWLIAPGFEAAMIVTTQHPKSTASGIMPLLSMMAAGVPVMAEHDNMADEIIEDAKSGLLYGRGDQNAASHGLMVLYRDRNAAKAMTTEARLLIENNYAIDDFCRQIDGHYESLLNTTKCSANAVEK